MQARREAGTRRADKKQLTNRQHTQKHQPDIGSATNCSWCTLINPPAAVLVDDAHTHRTETQDEHTDPWTITGISNRHRQITNKPKRYNCKKGPGWNDPMTAVVPRVKGFACYDLSFSRHNKNIKMEHFFLCILSRYFI